MGDMTVTYHYTSLAALADYYDNKAREERAKSTRENAKLKDKTAAIERAAVYESVAYTLRNTVISPGTGPTSS
jgi:hypothetical protein